MISKISPVFVLANIHCVFFLLEIAGIAKSIKIHENSGKLVPQRFVQRGKWLRIKKMNH